jgi:beta-glucosidase
VISFMYSWESEGFDRDDMKLPLRTNDLVSAILRANPRAVIVNQSGTPVEMPWIDQAGTLVQAFYGGNELGNGLADVLFGKVNPSGKLSMTFPKRLEDSPAYPSFGTRSEERNKTFYSEGIYVDYRGFDIRKTEPLFAFGHGISYTTFALHNIASSPIDESGKFTVSVDVKNTGEAAGREVVQIYIHDVISSLPRPPRELKGFKKTKLLQPGEQETLHIALDRDALGFFDDEKNAWVAEAGIFDILVSGDKVEVELKKSLQWNGL